jgi:tetratricopeptide (TPR) repeat protein
MSAICRSCESPLPDGARFCPECGAPVEGAADRTAAENQGMVAGKHGGRSAGKSGGGGRTGRRIPRERTPQRSEGWLGPYRTTVIVSAGVTILVLLFIGMQNRSPVPSALTGMPAGADPEQMMEMQRRLQDVQARLLQQPDDPGVVAEAANLFFDLGNYEEAVTLYRRALESSPENPALRTDLGTALHRLDLGQEAITEFRRVLSANPEFTTAKFNLGIVYLQMGDEEHAVEWFRQTIQDDPSSTLAEQARSQLDLIGREGRT